MERDEEDQFSGQSLFTFLFAFDIDLSANIGLYFKVSISLFDMQWGECCPSNPIINIFASFYAQMLLDNNSYNHFYINH